MSAAAAVASPTIAGSLAEAAQRLGPGGRLDAELLLCHVLGRPRSHLHAWPQHPVRPEALARFRVLVGARATGRPLAHLTGRREFWSLALEVGPATLVPRPETELLVERALEHLPPERPRRIADLGTGSGAIALALAGERPRCAVLATDLSGAALAVAGRNLRRLGLANVRLRRGPWLAALGRGRFDLIAANPPYVRRGDPHRLGSGLRHEPSLALDGGPDGLAALRLLVPGARRRLRRGGWLVLEHGADQGPALRRLMRRAGYARVRTWRDLAGHERVTEGQRPR